MPDREDPPAVPPRRLSPFVVVGALGVLVIGVLVWREVASIRASERELDRKMAALDRAEEEGAYGGEVVGGADVPVRLTEVQRQGPGTGGRYQLDVGIDRWALEVPPQDADEATWRAWEAQSAKRWTALAASLQALTGEGARVRAEIFAPWRDAPDAMPTRLLQRLMAVFAAAGVLDVDVDNAPAVLPDDE